MHFQRQIRLGGGLVSAMALMAAAQAVSATEVASARSSDDTPDAVIVTGTREKARTVYETLTPVDLISGKAVNDSVSSQLTDSLAQSAPSFVVQKLPTSDGLQFIRPAHLRGLSPDETLVLVDGKRFHRSAFLGTRGAQGADLAQIPNFAVDHVEVLRDGASAQYGSDAIAGVINILLDEREGLRAFAQTSQYFKGDGTTNQVGLHGGKAFDGGGHVSATLEYSDADPTSRTVQRPDAIAFQAANPTLTVANPVQRWGQPQLTTYRVALDGALPLSTFAEAYSFLIAGRGKGSNDINWRNPSTNASIYKTTSVFPGFNLNTLYPAGFTPVEGVKYGDLQAVGGVRGGAGSAFTWDLSGAYGRNRSSFFLNNSINASLGPNSPRSFQLGDLIQSEFNLNADGVYRLPVAWLAKPLNIAFGLERREETYEIRAGDPASYAVGPGAAVGLAPNSNGFPGFNPQQAGNWSQVSYAGYGDVEAHLTRAWSVDGALRYENFSEFGDTTNGKLATRYEITPAIALRGSVSSGFRAPTPAQLNSTSTSQGLDTVTLQLFTSGRLSPTSPVAAFLGAKPLKPEESTTVSGGLAWRTDFGFSGSIDAYQIDVDKRFSTSATVTVTPAIRAQLVAMGVSGASSFTSINWFTNDFNTRTTGIDVVGAYTARLAGGRVDLNAAYNYTKTEVTSGSLTASATQKRLFEEALPEHNATASVSYSRGPIELLARGRYYGPWTDSTGNATGDIFQRFGSIAFLDLALTYRFTPQYSLRIGAENVFDTYPDKAVFQASRGLVYSRNSPYDSYGGQYYVRLNVKM